jgi:hypothetical protein
MEANMNKKVVNLPAVARCGGNKKRLICMSLRAPTTIATSFIKIRKSNSYKSLPKLVAMVATRAHGHFLRSARKSASARLDRTERGQRCHGLCKKAWSAVMTQPFNHEVKVFCNFSPSFEPSGG